MSVNYNNFIFHSDRAPYGTTQIVEVEVDWAGTIASAGDYVWSQEIEANIKNVAPVLYITVPSEGAWSKAQHGDISANSLTVSGALLQSYGTWFGQAIPRFEYTEKGIRVGIARSWGVTSGSTAGTKTLPSRVFKIKVALNILPGVVTN